MEKILSVALGGGVGSVGRYLIARAADHYQPYSFPAATFIANLLGCLLMGILWAFFERITLSNEVRLFIFTGFLGGFTTFSTFARETTQLFQMGEYLQAFTYLTLSNVFGIGMVAIGFISTHRIIHW